MKIVVQVYRLNEWRNVTSISYSPSRERSIRNVRHPELCRKDALTEAHRAISAWRGSHQFTGHEMRLAEQTSYYGHAEPITN